MHNARLYCRATPSVALTSDGCHVVSGSHDYTLPWQRHPNGRLVAGSWDNTLRGGDPESGEMLRTFQGHVAEITVVALTLFRRGSASTNTTGWPSAC